MVDAEVEVGGHLVYRGDRDAAEVDPHAGTLGLAQYLFDKALHSGAGGAAGRGRSVPQGRSQRRAMPKHQ